jgi:pimeloyl-ACP methyl ester carboxylesterase
MFAELGDVRLFYTDEGTGEPAMLFVHGYSCDSNDWIWQLPHFARSHRAIAVDLRGHGRSSAPADGYETSIFARDVAALLAELDSGPVIAVGHSMGCNVVTALAVDHPGSVAAAVCVDPSYLISDDSHAAVQAVRDAMKADPVATAQSLLALSYAPASPAHLQSWHLRRIAGVPEHVLYQAMYGRGALSHRSVSEPYLRRRQCPVLAIYAHEDMVAAEAGLFADPRSRAFAWPGSGHWLHQERPAEFNAVVDAWLVDIGAVSAPAAP